MTIAEATKQAVLAELPALNEQNVSTQLNKIAELVAKNHKSCLSALDEFEDFLQTYRYTLSVAERDAAVKILTANLPKKKNIFKRIGKALRKKRTKASA